jgi:hypothetical protein
MKRSLAKIQPPFHGSFHVNYPHPVRPEKQQLYPDMKPQDDPDKATRALQRAQREKQFREMIKAVEYLYDWLDSGKSFEEIAIELDIIAAGTALSESSHKIWRAGIELIRKAREQGLDRNEVITHLRETAKAICEVTEREGWR